MDFVIAMVITVDLIMAIKMYRQMSAAKFDKSVYLNGTWWARVGFLMMFHSVIGIMCAVAYGLSLMVKATL